MDAIIFHDAVLGSEVPIPLQEVHFDGKDPLHSHNIICLALALLIPLLHSLVNLREGFIITLDTPYTCVSRDTDYVYSTYILPIAIVLAVTAFLLVLIFWRICSEKDLKKQRTSQKEN